MTEKPTRKFRLINREGTERYDLLAGPLERVAALVGEDSEVERKVLRLAATDVFVEKAMYHLTYRGFVNYVLAAFLASGTIVIAILFLFWIEGTIRTSPASIDPSVAIETGPLVLIVLERLASSAVFLSGIYLTASFARAFLHEGTILFSRRHALRFGRLYIYLSEGKITSEELFEAFGWNITPTTAFSKVRPELVTKGLVGQLGDALEKTAKSAATLAGKQTK